MNVCITEARKVRYMARRNDEIENYTSVDDQLRNEVNKPAPYCYYTLCPSRRNLSNIRIVNILVQT